MPAVLRSTLPPPQSAPLELGPPGPFPRIALSRVLERRWLHYAFLSRDGELGLVANVAWLGPAPERPDLGPRCTSILLVHKRGAGWDASQFNTETFTPLWSAFRQPHAHGEPGRWRLGATSGTPIVDVEMRRTSRPCTSQCAPFAPDHHLRWQSETGVIARGRWLWRNREFKDVEAIGYHERVRGYWGWPELGGWVFGFTNDPAPRGDGPPPTALVFTLIQPLGPRDAATGSVMLWRDGVLRRHFPRRCVSVAARGQLDRDRVAQVPELANLFGVPPMQPIPRRLIISARMGRDHVVMDFSCEAVARVVIPCETSRKPFSVHEVFGPCIVEGRLNGESFGFQTHGIVEFAGGAGGD